MPRCDDCTRGPSGIAGHDGLFSQTMGWDLMRFRCRACGTEWMRRSGARGGYDWAPPAGERPAMDTPGRPGTAAP